jgi:hypothetical protein
VRASPIEMAEGAPAHSVTIAARMAPSFDPLQTAKKVAEQATHATQAALGKMGDIKEAALSKVREVVDDLNVHLPALREAGYTLSELAVELGLTPKVVATFTSQPDISQERVDAVIDQHKEAKAMIALLRALFSAYKLQNGLHIVGMKPRGIALEIGLVPAVVVKFA